MSGQALPPQAVEAIAQAALLGSIVFGDRRWEWAHHRHPDYPKTREMYVPGAEAIADTLGRLVTEILDTPLNERESIGTGRWTVAVTEFDSVSIRLELGDFEHPDVPD